MIEQLGRKLLRTAVVSASALAFVAMAQAAPIAYPAKGQSPEQQRADDAECYAWAKSTTGIDPATVGSAPAPAAGPAVGGGERLAGAARGAVIGGIIDGGDGAGKGAALGVVAGGSRARQNQRSAQAQSQADVQGMMNTFYRAHSACMEGRGYTIK